MIPIVDGDWFEDDIVGRFRQFLRVAFGEQYFEENPGFVVRIIGSEGSSRLLPETFYKDYVQRYKKRPIYWLFFSPRARSTLSSTCTATLRRPPRPSLTSTCENSRRNWTLVVSTMSASPRDGNAPAAGCRTEGGRPLRKVLLELDQYEHDVLYPLATQQVQIDLDDGVKAATKVRCRAEDYHRP